MGQKHGGSGVKRVLTTLWLSLQELLMAQDYSQHLIQMWDDHCDSNRANDIQDAMNTLEEFGVHVDYSLRMPLHDPLQEFYVSTKDYRLMVTLTGDELETLAAKYEDDYVSGTTDDFRTETKPMRIIWLNSLMKFSVHDVVKVTPHKKIEGLYTVQLKEGGYRSLYANSVFTALIMNYENTA